MNATTTITIDAMGILNLLPNLKSVTKPDVPLSRYAGEIAAIDAMCW